ncbi:MAG TPA: calcium-binding protein [Solirubrobacterales bacterium]|nr:calcium-binding protein [Solirubrobacterales bacterium]
MAVRRGKSGFERGWWAAIALTIALWCLTGNAAAATVEAREETSASAVNRVSIEFKAASGEADDVTVSATQPQAGGPLDVQIADAGAPLEAMGGCSGGGAPATPVHCLVHAPKWTEYEICGRICALPKPGTEWRLTLRAELGDEPNSFDAAALPNLDAPPIDVTVVGGPQADEITTGPGNDRIDPGPGDDVVHAGGGWDTVTAGAGADGNDTYDLGPSSAGAVDYSQRSEPLRFEGGVGGGGGEQDHVDAMLLVGGSGDDVLVGGGGLDSFEGRGGNDVLVGDGDRNLLYGGAGNDTLVGGEGDDRLVGGSGDDTLEGGPGADALVEFAEDTAFAPESDSTPDEEPGGADLARGGPGDDWMSLGDGADTAYGEEGEDRIVTGAGTDKIEGGDGNDVLAGGTEFDEIHGGAGDDRIFAGPQLPQKEPGLGFAAADVPGPGHDAVECGAGRDFVAIDPADWVKGCERVALEDAIEIGRPIRDRSHGTALLPVHVGEPGRIAVYGPRIGKVERGARQVPAGDAVAMVPVRPRGAARAALRRSGRCRVQVRVRYRRRNGGTFTAKRKLTLLLARS